ncbi:SIR2 family protein [Paenibacillus sp. LjRoot56]|uniref:SIR2 family protein n=1 Tax=Paenibacillus sp. LjRoot56 TaxID=3342333 RepID=UPI003ED015A2
MSKVVVLTGNGLSVALNRDFSLPNITRRFQNRLSDEHRAFIEHHMGGQYNQIDFEESIASIEQSYDALQNYYNFLSNGVHGERFMQSYGLEATPLMRHVNAIKEIIHEYTASILDLIDGHVHHTEIEEHLSGFVSWLNATLRREETEVDLFTLNFDLLLETILLEEVGTEGFMDFHHRGRRWDAIDNNFRFNFNPDLSKQIAGNRKIRLHHLHGSLSSFKNVIDGKLFKVKTEDLRDFELYDRIFDLDLIPSIVTGGGKSIKIQHSPFNFYYNEFKKKMYIEDQLCDELYIVGYSFRDDHINKAIAERLKLARNSTSPRPLNIVIVDFAATQAQKDEFIERVNTVLELGPRTRGRFVVNDTRIIFDGANGIRHLLN